MPLHFQVVAVADPRKFARTKLGKQHNIGGENLFEGLHIKAYYNISAN